MIIDRTLQLFMAGRLRNAVATLEEISAELAHMSTYAGHNYAADMADDLLGAASTADEIADDLMRRAGGRQQKHIPIDSTRGAVAAPQTNEEQA